MSNKKKAVFLIVDDDEPTRRLIVRLLESQGHRCLEAGTAQRALDLARSAKPDAMLIDLVLGPDNGWEVLRQAREAWRLPVLIITGGDAGEDTTADARALGARAVLKKPFEGGELLAAAALLLEPPSRP